MLYTEILLDWKATVCHKRANESYGILLLRLLASAWEQSCEGLLTADSWILVVNEIFGVHCQKIACDLQLLSSLRL